MKKKILIIEDEPGLAKILSLRLEKKGFEVAVAYDGASGLVKARHKKPDIILLDLMLPKLPGEEVCRQIRKDDTIGRTPIIMLTAKATDVDRIIGRVIGADSYIMKPFSIDKLTEEIKKLMQINKPLLKGSDMEFKERLLALLKKEALKKGKFTLSSGRTSNYYLDGRILTLTPEGAFLVANIILAWVQGKNIDAIGGPTLGADPIVGAIAVLSHIENIAVKTFIVRKQTKGHGMQRQIEGPALKKKERAILVDDVATTGKALLEAKEALEKIGVIADEAIVIVDRGEGAKENLARVDLKLDAIFGIDDLGL